MPNCPDRQLLMGFSLGQISETDAALVQMHLRDCPACLTMLEELGRGDEFVRALQAQGAGASVADAATIARLVAKLQAQPDTVSVARDRDTAAEGVAAPVALTFLGPAQATDELGRLGPYRVKRLIGVGGMGLVFEAEDPQLRRSVALKVLRPERASDPQQRARFLREGRAAAALQHDYVVAIHQVGEHEGLPYLAMEFLRGESLDERLRRVGRLDALEAARLGRQAAEGLAAAHRFGLIHRDVKPANLWVEKLHDGSERIKVLDFGLARVAESLADTGAITQTGMLLGTPRYLSPEQATGEPLDHRTDVYSLGVTLYELIAGQAPFDSRDIHELLGRIIQEEPPPPRQLHPAIPPDLETIVLKAMAKEAKERYATAQDLADDLQRFAEDKPILARRPTLGQRVRRWGRKNQAVVWSTGVAAAVLLLLTVVGLTIGLVVVNNERAQKEFALDAERTAKQTAEDRLTKLQQGNALLSSVFENLDPWTEEKEGKTLRLLLGERLDRATAELAGEAVGDALVVARLQTTLGESQRGLGNPEKAVTLLAKARATFVASLGAEHADTLSCTTHLANTYADLGRDGEALRLREEMLAIHKTKFGPDHPFTLCGMNNLASSYSVFGRHAEALALQEETLARLQASAKVDDHATFQAMNNLALSYVALGRHEDALSLREKTLALKKTRLGDGHPDTLRSMRGVANSYAALGRHADALKLHEETLEVQTAQLGPDHRDTLGSRQNVANAIFDLGRHAEALAFRQVTLARRLAKFGPNHPDTLSSAWGVAQCLVVLDRGAEAVPLIDDCVARAAGQVVHPLLVRGVLFLRLEHFQKTSDAAGCRATAATWEARKGDGADGCYDAARMRAVTAAVLRAANDASAAEQEAIQALSWLRQAVTAGFKDAERIKKEKDFDGLRDRPDFKRLVAELDARAPS